MLMVLKVLKVLVGLWSWGGRGGMGGRSCMGCRHGLLVYGGHGVGVECLKRLGGNGRWCRSWERR